MLQIYYADVSGLPPCADDLLFSDYRREQLKRITHAQKRRQAIGAELLLIAAMKKKYPELVLPLRIGTEERGKPFFLEFPDTFSLSHSDKFAACVLGDQKLGIDVQADRPYHEAVARQCFTPQEREWLRSCGAQDYGFSMLWSLKESCIKASGIGLPNAMLPLSMDFEQNPNIMEWKREKLWHTYREGFHFSLCIPDGIPQGGVELIKIKLL